MNVNKKIICLGPGPKFKGGIAHFNTSLAKALQNAGVNVTLISWSQQYPAFIPRKFEDNHSKTKLVNSNILVEYLLNYNNPLSWQKTVAHIKTLKPDMVIIQWALAVQGWPLGYIAKQLQAWGKTKIVFDVHNVVQKEDSKIDNHLIRKGLNHGDAYIFHSKHTKREFETVFPEKKNAEKLVLFHPVYDIFEEDTSFDVAAFKQKQGLKKHVFLFFGFIRKYKGLHNAIEAFAKLAKERDDISLLICGESFWKDSEQQGLKTAVFSAAKKVFYGNKEMEKYYNPLEKLTELGLDVRWISNVGGNANNTILYEVVVFNDFIPNEDVHQYFQACDAVLLFYEYATPSGIESIALNFGKPVLASPVGFFNEGIVNGQNGYVANDNAIKAFYESMMKIIETPIAKQTIRNFGEARSWQRYVDRVLSLL